MVFFIYYKIVSFKSVPAVKKYFNNNEKIEYYKIYDLLDHELVMMFDWINGNNNLNEYMKK